MRDLIAEWKSTFRPIAFHYQRIIDAPMVLTGDEFAAVKKIHLHYEGYDWIFTRPDDGVLTINADNNAFDKLMTFAAIWERRR